MLTTQKLPLHYPLFRWCPWVAAPRHAQNGATSLRRHQFAVRSCFSTESTSPISLSVFFSSFFFLPSSSFCSSVHLFRLMASRLCSPTQRMGTAGARVLARFLHILSFPVILPFDVHIHRLRIDFEFCAKNSWLLRKGCSSTAGAKTRVSEVRPVLSCGCGFIGRSFLKWRGHFWPELSLLCTLELGLTLFDPLFFWVFCVLFLLLNGSVYRSSLCRMSSS